MNKLIILNEFDFESRVILSESLVLVYWSASWCSPCKALEPILEKLSTEIPNSIFKIDIDGCKDLTKTYSIRSVPTVAAFKDGKVIGTKVGLTNKDALLKLLE